MRLSRVARQSWGNPLKNGASMFTNLWSKPNTKDERVKEYVPEVIEESLTEQRAVLNESTSRDRIVESGYRLLQEVENKSPTPSIAPHMQTLLLEFGAPKDLIGQRALSQLLYPSVAPTPAVAALQAHELVSGFLENCKRLVEHVEVHGSSVKARRATSEGEETKKESERTSSNEEPDEGNRVVMAKPDEVEPLDITMFAKVTAAMALANLHTGDLNQAMACCDAALRHAVDPKRIGGLHGMRAGIYNKMKKYELAAEAARLSIEASDNVQGYLQGAAALRQLKRDQEVVALLEQGKEAHPSNEVVGQQLLAVKKDLKLALTE
jgi:tetratricopeptide (TPR) repeat protein